MRVVLKKRVSLIFIVTKPIQCYHSECLMCVGVGVGVVYLHHFYQYCTLKAKPSLITSNQQVYDFTLTKCIMFEKKRHCGK